MINVVIADDEPLALIELRSLIPWEENGFRIIGEFRNGKSALDFLTEHEEADLAILDINMPAMSGLKVIEERNRIDRPVEYLVVSAYSDYPLVRKAFKMGISDYIIKEELEPENLLPVLQKIAARIERRRINSTAGRTGLQKEEREALIRFLTAGGSVPDIAPLNCSGKAFRPVKIEQLTCREGESSADGKALLSLIEEAAEKVCPGAFCLEDEKCCYLILPFDNDDKNAAEKCRRFSGEIKQRVKLYFNKLLILSWEESGAPEELPSCFGKLKLLRRFRSRGIRLSMEYIQEHYSESELSFEDLCSLTGSSRSYLSSLFKQETGVGYKDYLNEVRISHALSLLDKSDIKVQEVSDHVGFSNVEHFSRTFKSRTGISPSQYSRRK